MAASLSLQNILAFGMFFEAARGQIKEVKVQGSLCDLKFMAYLISTILLYAIRWKFISKQVDLL